MTTKESFGHGYMMEALRQSAWVGEGALSVNKCARLWGVSKPTAKKWLTNMHAKGLIKKEYVMSHGKISFEVSLIDNYYNWSAFRHEFKVYRDYINPNTKGLFNNE